uniref:Integrase core domain containing protein n=1 Tax=Solanum tuberosum TaxID=4113 RepID=M1DGE0_SOLTU
MARLITEECRVLTGSLHTIPDIHRLFQLHKCDWMARDLETYIEEIVWEFYASYAATLRSSIGKRVSSTKADNQLTWDRAVMVATLVAGLEIDSAYMLLAEIHERAFKTSTTYPFPCLIFQLCRDFGVPIWHCDRLIHPTGTLDVGLIRDEVNVAAPRRGPQIDMPLGTNLVDVVEQMQGDELAPPAHIDDAPASSSQAASQALSSSKATPLSGANVIPLVRVQKLEAQMATLLHHIKPWMRKLIVDSEVRVKKRMEAKMDHKVQAVHKRLDAFELRVLERPAYTTDMSSFRIELASLRAVVDAILATPAVAPQSQSLLGHVHLNLGQKPKLRVANVKGSLNLGLDPTSGIVYLNQWKIHKLRVAMKEETKRQMGMKRV